MLLEMTPEEMDGWAAMDRVLPIGDEKVCWVLARGFALLVNRLNRLCFAWGVKDLKEAKPKDFIPWIAKKKKKKSKYMNPNAAAAAFLMAMNR